MTRKKRIALAEPGHLLIAGRLAGYRELMASKEIARATRLYARQRHDQELARLLDDVQGDLVAAGYDAKVSSHPTLIVEMDAVHGPSAWIAWQATEATPKLMGILPLLGAVKAQRPEFRTAWRLELGVACQEMQGLDADDSLVVFLANLGMWVGEAVEELRELSLTLPGTPKARWAQFVHAIEQVKGWTETTPTFDVMQLTRSPWVMSADLRAQLKDRWQSPAVASSDAIAALGAVLEDWCAAGEEASSQPRRRLAAALARAEHVSEKLARALDTLVREIGRSRHMDVRHFVLR